MFPCPGARRSLEPAGKRQRRFELLVEPQQVSARTLVRRLGAALCPANRDPRDPQRHGAVDELHLSVHHEIVPYANLTVDAASRMVTVKIDLPNPGVTVRPGMLADVRLE